MSRPQLLSLLEDPRGQESTLRQNKFERAREIENSFHLEMIAQTNEDLAVYYANTLRTQARLAVLTLRNYTGMFSSHDPGHFVSDQDMELPNSLSGDIARFLDGAVLPLVETTEQKAAETSDMVKGLPSTASETCERFAATVLRKQVTLNRIAESMRQTYEGSTVPLRKEAETWLISGMRRTGTDRQHDFADAMRLLRVCVENPFGMQDYVAWFQIGWILWRHQNVAAAEEAFYRAQRLSALKPDLYYVKSVLHLAHMQYLQGRFEDAYVTIQKAVIVQADHETMFDAARYAARTGRRSEALDYLEKCIRERPTTVVSMFAETDFQKPGEVSVMTSDMAALVARLQSEACARARLVVIAWQKAVETVQQAEHTAEVSIKLPSHLATGTQQAITTVAGLDYLTALNYEKTGQGSAEQVLRSARTQLEEERKQRKADINKAKIAVTEAEDKHRDLIHKAVEANQERIANIPSIGGKASNAAKVPNIAYLAVGIGAEIALAPTVHTFLMVDPDGKATNNLINTDLYLVFLCGSWFVLTYLLYFLGSVVDHRLRKSRSANIELEFNQTLRNAETIADTEFALLRGRVERAKNLHQNVDNAIQVLDWH